MRSVGLGLLVVAAVLAAGPVQAFTFTVNSTGDQADINLADNNCDVGGGVCTLRAAIQEANDSGPADTINFNIGGGGAQTIVLTAGLPPITDKVTIDGWTQGGGGYTGPPLVEINAAAAPGDTLDLQTGSSASTIRGLCINRSPGAAIRMLDSSTNIIAGNFLGTNLAGDSTAGFGNGVGINITGNSDSNTIGGTTAANRNIISGDTVDGIQINGGAGDASLNLVQGNYIGTDKTGTVDLGNTNQGVAVFGNSPNNTIGGTAAGAGNVISGNNGRGVQLGSSTTTGTLIQGNKIGTNAAGTASVPNTVAGVNIYASATNITIGGTSASARNIISGNTGAGIQIDGVSNNLVQGNYIGTDVTGAAALANGGRGVRVHSAATNNTIGGAAAGAGNVISGNSGRGIEIVDLGTNGNVVRGNKIGTNAAGTAGIPNFIAGISVAYGASNNTIGGTAANEGNLIAFNTGEGIHVVDIPSPALNNAILGNAIHSNGGLGIDLNDDGVTPNDAAPDADTGPNNLQNYPVLTAALTNGLGTFVNFAGSLDSALSTTYRIEFFESTTADRQGERYLGFINVTTNGSGTVTFGVTLGVNLAAGKFVTATATDPSNNTSEFSAPILAYSELVVTTTADTVDGTTTSVSALVGAPGADGRISLREAIAATNATAGLNTIRFGIPPAGAKTIVLGSALPNITSPVTIDGTSQPGWVNAPPYAPVIELNGTSGGGAGLRLEAGSDGSTIRGLAVNRCGSWAIVIKGSSNNVIAGNFLGTNLAGTAALANGTGITIGSAVLTSNNRVGGTVAADRNVISGNDVDGIQVSPWGAGNATANNVIEGNYIGTDVTGTVALGNFYQGIAVFTGGGGTNTSTVIGGTAPGAGNLISGNGGHGITVHEAGTTGTLVQGNKIGTNALGTAGIANSGDGVRIFDSASSNTVGGTAANAGNFIAYNGGAGISLVDNTTVNNAILGNAIYANGGLGVDLNPAGVTANDGGDGDSGPNDLLNYPLLTASNVSGANLTTYFQLDVPAGSYRIEFFRNPLGADGTAFGEGQVFAGTSNVTHPGGGALPFNHIFPGVAGDVITATATRCTDGAACTTFGSTSEFSKALNVATTAVTLLLFSAAGRDRAVDLSWTTASELSNLGFHLYRADAVGSPYTRITPSLVPGLGSSPTGQSYAYRDSGLVNGRTYYYQLEDVETTGRTERHGPVSATTSSETKGEHAGSTYGDPSGVLLREIERDGGHVLLELLTPGFVAVPTGDGRVRVSIPGFTSASEAGEPLLPARRAFLEAASGRKVRLTSVQASDELHFPGLRPVTQGMPEIATSADGMVLPSERAVGEGRAFRTLFPSESARLLGASFQGETKKAEVLLYPLRWDGSGLVLSRRLVVRLDFVGREAAETSLGGSKGRRAAASRRGRIGRGLAAQLVARERGLYALAYEDVFENRAQGMSAAVLRLSREGEDVAFHVEPDPTLFGPGSTLYFVSEGSELNPYGDAVYELETGTAGTRMPVDLLSVASPSVDGYYATVRREENVYYQAGLLGAPDLWLWDLLVSGAQTSPSYTFAVDHVSAARPAYVSVSLQGASDFADVVDHHVRLGVNGISLGETTWDGKEPKGLDLEIGPGVLHEGANTLEFENVGDTGATYSLVFLNRFSVRYPRALVASGGTLEGTFASSGQAVVGALPSSSVVLDTTETPRWKQGASPTPTGLSFPVEAGRRYLATSVVQHPLVRRIQGSALRRNENQADYLVLGPKEFLPAAQPLLALRESEGLATMAVSFEDVYEQFGHGEVSPEAIKVFLEYAYQSWASPSVRYVVLLGDASYDPKDYLGTGVKDWLPGFPVKTSYLWTVSDPAYASVNGEDLLPDFAIGRLPAGSLDEAQRMVEKILSYENRGGRLDGPAVLVADNADAAGNFERDADEIASGVLEGRKVRKIYYSEQGANTRASIKQAFDDGASLLSYVGHGATAVWASENIFRNQDVSSLHAQSRQPLLLTMNCLNGFFQFPPLNSLSEELLKAEGKGAIAAFSPSGLSVDDAAHLYHKALLREILSRNHARLGDAILAAQRDYADSGSLPELLSIYHLFGDPALSLR